jgi:uncharacterized protein (DUF1330 family)
MLHWAKDISFAANGQSWLREVPMAAYMIILVKVHDRARFLSAYGAPAADLVAAHGGEYVLRAPGVEMLEGEGFDGASAVISKWPDKVAALRFWNSPDYAELKRVRADLADAHVMVVEEPSS